MLKYFLIAVVGLSLVALVGCVVRTPVVGEQKTYRIGSDIHSLDIKISAAEFVIEQGEELIVESNLKNLTVTEQDGVLMLIDKTKSAVSYADAKLKLTIPEGKLFEDASISTGAGKLSAKTLSANTMELKTGAGQVEFEHLEVNSDVKIKGGAGEITVLDGTLNNLSLNLGVGEFNMTAKLKGESNLKFGVGQSNLTLIGSKNDYRFDVENGIGKISIDNSSATFYADVGNGENLVKITGGVGETNIEFQE
ncbi:MAG: DUF4097 family beta strand repeat protein [Clostridia bacterium]|nr:DUF4097 family beta strand repeat protein [Clostridia bacterium]